MRDYSSNYKIKKFAMEEVAPKYFPNEALDAYNIGLIGFSTDVTANAIEDMYNTVPMLMNEMFPNLSNMPETIYNNAALFQEEGLLATPAEMDTVLLVNVEDIKRYATNRGSGGEFMIDSDTIIDIEGQQFILDYDIRITVKPYKNDFIYTAAYDVTFNNGLSDIRNPYIKSQKINYNKTVYLALFIKVRCASAAIYNTHLINNDKINVPGISFTYADQLCNFEVFYKEHEGAEWVQLSKKILHSIPIKSPFCYYRLKNENTVEISFTTRDRYFKPKFNSEILVKYWTTNGDEGNFPLYKGEEIVVRPTGAKYEYNENIPFFTIPQSESRFGKSGITLDELKAKVVDNFSTVLSYTSEPDLQRYFNSFKYKYNQDVLFVKKRDDLFERLFSSFSLLKDKNGDFYKTNTLHLEMKEDDFDIKYDQSDRRIIKPGRVFKYRSDEDRRFVITDNEHSMTSLTGIDEEYAFTNPFLMSVSKAGVVGYYLNSLDKRIPLDYSYINSDSLVQFICNNIFIKRNALLGEDEYELRLDMSVTDIDMESPLVDEEGRDTKRIKVKIMFQDKSGKEMCYLDAQLESFNKERMHYTFVAKLKTDDYLSISEKIRVTNVKQLATGEEYVAMLPMRDLVVNIHTFFRYEGTRMLQMTHKYRHLNDLTYYTLTNSYTLGTQKINLAQPLNMLKSNSKYRKKIDEDHHYVDIKGVPLVRAYDLADYDRFMYMLEMLDTQYQYMSEILDKKTNNYSVDMKFFNSYGRSVNFGVDDDLTDLDVVNCKIHFKLATYLVPNMEELIRDMKDFIKEYFENINNGSLDAIYISNLIQSLENEFSEIKYLKFVRFNNYGTSVQNIENKCLDLNSLTKEQRLEYVPEFLNIELDDILIELIN